MLLLGSPAFADDAVNQHIQNNYIDPILDQIGTAARTAADPNGFAEPNLLMPGLDTMSPHARRAVDYAKTRLIDPLTDASQNTAAQAARVLGSSDANATAPGLEDHIFDFPNQMALQITQMIREMMTSREALSAPADPLPGDNLPANLRKKMTPVATPKDFAYRKDSTTLVRGGHGSALGGRKLKGLKPL